MDRLNFIESFSRRSEYQARNLSEENRQLNKANSLIEEGKQEIWVTGFCSPCKSKQLFLVDSKWGGKYTNNKIVPNWRERCECKNCMMNNRQRLMCELIEELFAESVKKMECYFMEQVTPIFNWAKKNVYNHNIIGSEYLSPEFESGCEVNGIRHENIESLSFDDISLDLIVSNDVFEHVPHPSRAFVECARVLKQGGVMLATIPFHSDREKSVIRSAIKDGDLEHYLAPEYHGNPISEEGSLVFTDFGWDLIDMMHTAGFKKVRVESYSSFDHAYLGPNQLVFRAVK